MKKKSIIIVLIVILLVCAIGGAIWFISTNKETEDVASADVEATAVPTEEPIPEPTEAPTPDPTEVPTPEPTEVPTPEPTEVPTPEPTEAPTPEPTEAPVPEPADNTNPAFYDWVSKETEEADIKWYVENFGVSEAELRTWDNAKWQKAMDDWLNKALHSGSHDSSDWGEPDDGDWSIDEEPWDLEPAPLPPPDQTLPGKM